MTYDFLISLLRVVNDVFLLFLLAQCVIYLVHFVVACFEMFWNMHKESRWNVRQMLTRDITFSVSILVPAYNEETTVVENIHSMLSLQYPDFEVVVINDGSRDRTLQAVVEHYGLKLVARAFKTSIPHERIRGLYASPRHPRLLVIDKENGGKADALNAGINLARFPIVCSIDADSILNADSLMRAVRPFVEEPERMVAVGGCVRVVNGSNVVRGQVVQFEPSQRALPLFQNIEYLRAFLIARSAWSRMGSMLIISGAFGLFKRSAVIDVGGYSTGTVGEDMELVVRLHRHLCDQGVDYRMRFVPDPICWTEAPVTLGPLRTQRTRWQRGLMESLWRHRGMILNPRYGSVGLVGMMSFVIFDVLGPFLECLGFIMVPVGYLVGALDISFFVAWLSLMFTYGVFLSVGSLVLAESFTKHKLRSADLLLLGLSAVAENFGYRQLNSLWRLEGILQFLRGRKEWGTIPRKGLQKTSTGNTEEGKRDKGKGIKDKG